MSYRINTIERDLSGFTQAQINEVGAMVVKSAKGKFEPVLCQRDTEVLSQTGYPSATYPSVFEAVAYVKQAPLWVVCPYGEDSLWGGIDVKKSDIEAFEVGRINPDSFDFKNVNTLNSGVVEDSVPEGVVQFTGTISDIPFDQGSIAIKVNGSAIDAEDDEGVISGDDIDSGGTNTIDYETGAYDFTVNTDVVETGDKVTIEYTYDTDKSAEISHSFFVASPCEDELAMIVEAITGSQFKMTLYEKNGSTYNYIDEYNYSLIREKDNFGKSLYYEDIFRDNPYVIIKVNSDYVLTGSYTVDSDRTDVNGGYRQAPLDSDINTAWEFFHQPNKYRAKIFMDVFSGFITKINSVIQSYQKHGFGITILSIGNSVTDSVSERQGLSLDSDDVAFYDNWYMIEDPYNNSYAWISNIGSIGKKYAMMKDIYDSGAPAGIDADGHGGQLSDWRYVKAEKDYSQFDLQTLDEAQINPVIFHDTYGVMVWGDKTGQVSLSDTSYIGARRAYDYLIDIIETQILLKQVFKLNDQPHREKARVMADEFIRSTFGAVGAFRDWYVKCDDENNNDAVLNQRKFILDIFVKITPTSEWVTLRLTRLAQNQVIAEFI